MLTPSRVKLRNLILEFYRKHDPTTLNAGFDIQGLVDFTTKKGIDYLNRMLYRKYGHIIDVYQEFRKNISSFFNKFDPGMMSECQKNEFEALADFYELNGLPKLNEKLIEKYGEGLEWAEEFKNVKIGYNPFKLDRNRLRDDLETFYTEMEDFEQLEVLDEITARACQIGIIRFDKNLKWLYGTSLNVFLDQIGRPGHENITKYNPMETTKVAKIPRESEDMTEVEEWKAFSTRTFKEQKYRIKLSNYFYKVDPQMMSAAWQAKLEKFVKFVMLNGLEKLNEKLKLKYGVEVEDDDEKSQVNTANDGLDPFKLDRNRLRDDLETFYREMKDYRKLEVLDEMTDWACQIGIIELDKNLKQLYGIDLNDYLARFGRPGHENYSETDARPLPQAAEAEVERRDIVMDTIQVPVIPKEFDDMTDGEILEELEVFYSTYDEDNLCNLEKVLEICRNIGRAKLNEHLMKIYEAKLTPVPAFIEQTVEREKVLPLGDQSRFKITFSPAKQLPAENSSQGSEQRKSTRLPKPRPSGEEE